MVASESSLLLITGASGHVGYRTLLFALESGYRVRAAVRNDSKANLILASAPIQKLAPGSNLSFVFVKDILADNAFAEAVKGVTYIAHVASPIPSASTTADYEMDLIQPAIRGTIGILEAAIQEPSVKRIVITSSVVAHVPFGGLAKESATVYHPDDEVPNPSGPYDNPMAAYAASKIFARNATTQFIKARTPHFDVINVMPTFIIGRSELVQSPEEAVTQGTNKLALLAPLGNKLSTPSIGGTVHVDDVACIHVLSLDPKVKGGKNFSAHSGTYELTSANEIVKKSFPEAVKKGIFSADGDVPSTKLLVDASKTEEVLGFKFLDWESQVVSVAGHYLELVAKQGGRV